MEHCISQPSFGIRTACGLTSWSGEEIETYTDSKMATSQGSSSNMSGEIITIGDELLYGHGVHTNSAYLGERLTSLGIEVKYKSIVGDAVTHIVEDMA